MAGFNQWKKDKVYAERKSKFYGFLFRVAVTVGVIVMMYVYFVEKYIPIQSVPFVKDSFVAQYFSSYKTFVETPDVNMTYDVNVSVPAEVNTTVTVTPQTGTLGDDSLNGAKLVIILYDNNKSTITYNQGSCDLNSSCNNYLQGVLKSQKLIN